MTRPIADTQAFLRRFYGDGNALKWDVYVSSGPSGATRVALEPWISRFENHTSPFALPRVEPTTKRTSWYVLCTNPREARAMRELLLAFVGPTYALFDGELADLSSTDPIDRLCEEHFGSLIYRLPVANGDDRKEVSRLLSTLFALREQHPTRVLKANQPVGRLLRDLEMAILVQNEESAWEAFREIRGRGRLSSTNLAFLQIYLLASFERWNELIDLPQLSDILHVRRPKRISELIAAAAYLQYLHVHERANDPLAAIELLRTSLGRYQALVRSTESFQSRNAIKLAVVSAVASNPPNLDRAQRLIQSEVYEEDQPWCQALVDALCSSSRSTATVEASGHRH